MIGTRMRLAAATGVAVLALGLGGCAAQPDLTADDGAAFHARVTEIANRSLAGDLAGAVGELDQLSTEVDSAADDGRLGESRETRIRSAMDLVRADLQVLIAQAAADEAARQAAEAEAARVAAEQAEAERAAEEAKDDEDKGGGKDDGPGKGDKGPGSKGPGKDDD